MKSIGDHQGDRFSILQSIEGDRFSILQSIEGDQFSILQSIEGDQFSILQSIEGDQFSILQSIEGNQFSLLQSIAGDQFDLVAFPVNESVLYLLLPAATCHEPSGRPAPCCTRPQIQNHTWLHSRLEHPQDESCTFLTGHGHQSHRTSAPVVWHWLLCLALPPPYLDQTQKVGRNIPPFGLSTGGPPSCHGASVTPLVALQYPSTERLDATSKATTYSY